MNIKDKLNTFNFKTLGYLVIFSITILLFFWILQLTFVKVFYEKYQLKNIEKIGSTIEESTIDSLNETLEAIAFKNNLCIEVNYKNGLVSTYNARIPSCILRFNNIEILRYKKELIDGNVSSRGIKLVDPETDNKTILYMVKVDNAYVFINSPLEDINATSNTINNQLVYIILIAILLSVLIAYFVTKRIARPITNITKKAKNIGKGEQIVFDYTGIKEIDELVSALNNAEEQVEKNEGLRRDLLANVSHDLKTPLTMIKAYAEMVKDFSYKDKKKREEHLDIIVSETDRLNILVNDILELSKMQADAYKLNIEKFDLKLEIDDILKRYEIVKTLEEYHFNLEVPDNMIVMADKNKINQVIYNLINNAINYTGENKQVTIKATLEDNDYLVEIMDTGKGIKEDEIEFIWDKYYKNEKNHQRNVVGTGIGLSIVKEILTKHNFEYGVESKLKKGTTFYFKIKKNK